MTTRIKSNNIEIMDKQPYIVLHDAYTAKRIKILNDGDIIRVIDDISGRDLVIFGEVKKVVRNGDYAEYYKNGILQKYSTDHADVIEQALEDGGVVVIDGEFDINSTIKIDQSIERLAIIGGKLNWKGTGHAIDLASVDKLYVSGLHVVGQDGSVRPQGALRAYGATMAIITGSVFEKMLPDIDTDVFQVVRLSNYKIIVVEDNIVAGTANIGDVRGYDNLTLASDSEDSIVVVKNNRIEQFGDGAAMWGGLCVADGNQLIGSAFDRPLGIDFARCGVAVAYRNRVSANTIANAILFHAASGTIQPRTAIIAYNKIEMGSSANNDAGVQTELGDEVIIIGNVIVNPYRGIYVHSNQGAVDRVVIRDNRIVNPSFIGVAVYADTNTIASVRVEGNIIENPSGHSVFYLRNGNGELDYVEARGNRVVNPGTLSVGIWNVAATKKKILDNEPGINGDGVAQVLSDCGNVPSSGDYVGQLVTCYDSASSKWVLKVWDGSAWQTIG